MSCTNPNCECKREAIMQAELDMTAEFAKSDALLAKRVRLRMHSIVTRRR